MEKNVTIPDMDGAYDASEEFRSVYRTEQNRLLRRRLLGTMGILLVAWTVGFLVVAAVFNAVMVPRIADAVADAVAPWRYVSADSAGTADWDAFQASVQVTKENMAVSYVTELYGSSDGEGSPRAGASREALALADGVRERYPVDEGSEVGASSDVLYISYDVSMEARKAIESAVGDVAQTDREAFARLFQEAMDFYGMAEDTTVVNGFGGYYDIYYLDGHYEYRDMTVYNLVKSFKIPLAVALFLAGVIVIMWLVLRRSLEAFDTLFGAMESVLLKRDAQPYLPRELEPTSRAIEAIRHENEANELAARAAEQRKNELVAYLAHDIRTPLTSVVGYLTMLQESPDMPMEQRARYAGIALDRAQRLEGMLEEFFEITRYNLQSIPIERERFDASMLCRQVADEFYPTAEARDIAIEVESPDTLQVFADPNKVSRVLNNLLKNAVSYADEGSVVHVRAHVAELPLRSFDDAPFEEDGVFGKDGASRGHATQGEPIRDAVWSAASAEEGGAAPASEPRDAGAASPSARWLTIEVANQGREISPAHLQSIFEKFYREDASRGTQGGGAGLGLAIAREIARAHGGDLAARSENGNTTFSLVIPA